MVADSPSTSSTLAMFDPTTLPTARSASSRSAAPRLTASSGALVPNATTVRPMTTGERPVRAASRAAPRTNASAPVTRATTPTTKNTPVSRSMTAASLAAFVSKGNPDSKRWPDAKIHIGRTEPVPIEHECVSLRSTNAGSAGVRRGAGIGSDRGERPACPSRRERRSGDERRWLGRRPHPPPDTQGRLSRRSQLSA